MKLGHTTTVLPALKKSLLLDHESLLSYFSSMKTEKKTTLSEVYITENFERNHIRQVLEDIVKFPPHDMQTYGESGDVYTSPIRTARGSDPYNNDTAMIPARQPSIGINWNNYF